MSMPVNRAVAMTVRPAAPPPKAFASICDFDSLTGALDSSLRAVGVTGCLVLLPLGLPRPLGASLAGEATLARCPVSARPPGSTESAESSRIRWRSAKLAARLAWALSQAARCAGVSSRLALGGRRPRLRLLSHHRFCPGPRPLPKRQGHCPVRWTNPQSLRTRPRRR